MSSTTTIIMSASQEPRRQRYSFWSLLSFDSLNLESMRLDPSKMLPNGARMVNYFGVQVLFHPFQEGGRHLTTSELEPYRQIGDPPLDDLLEFMSQHGCPLKAGDDLFSKRYIDHVQNRIVEFCRYYETLPEWVNVEQLERGQQVFLRFIPAIGLSLYCRSFVAGFSIPKIAQVLAATKYLAPPSTPNQVADRIVDTGAMVWSCMGYGGVESLLPGEYGWKMALYVRVLHAKVRRLLLKRGDWKVNEFGVPINQEDMAATLLGFSINSLKGIEYVSGVDICQKDQEDFLALWRYVGWLLGVQTDHDAQLASLRPLDPCSPGWTETPDSIRHSECMMQSMILHLMQPTSLSVTIAHHLLKVGGVNRDKDGNVLPKTPAENEAQRKCEECLFYSRALSCRYFIGDPLADALQLPFHPQPIMRFYISFRVSLRLWFVRLYTWAALWKCVARLIQHHHLKLVEKFHNKWKESHSSRMAKALHIQKESCCPFAMIKC